MKEEASVFYKFDLYPSKRQDAQTRRRIMSAALYYMMLYCMHVLFRI